MRYLDAKKAEKPFAESAQHLVAMAEEAGFPLPDNAIAVMASDHGRAMARAKTIEGAKRRLTDVPAKVLMDYPGAWLSYKLEIMAETVVNAYKATTVLKRD